MKRHMRTYPRTSADTHTAKSADVLELPEGLVAALAAEGISAPAASYTVATLPAGTVGDTADITDGDSGLAWGATALNSGAGATPYMVWFNGTNWTVVGK